MIGVATMVVAQPYTAISLHPSLPGLETSQATGAGAGYQTGTLRYAPNLFRAAGWVGTAASVIDLHPPGMAGSKIVTQEGLWAGGSLIPTIGNEHAGLWQLSGGGWFDLHPTGGGFLLSGIRGVTTGQQVGWALGTSFDLHAILWADFASTWVDLTPPGASAEANDVRGGIQVGYANGPTTGFVNHAFQWAGTAGSAIDIHPAGYSESIATGTTGTQHVGNGIIGGSSHALLWTGTTSVLDLHPIGYSDSYVKGLTDTIQFGSAKYTPADQERATIWTGSASTAVDLHQFLPATATTSTVLAADEAGNLYGVAGYPDVTLGTTFRATMWRKNDYTFSGFNEPVNDPATPESVFKRNKTIHLKFSLTDANGANVGYEVATLTVTKLGPSNEPVNDPGSEEPTDTGGVFTYEPGPQVYSYKFGTKDLESGMRYRLTVTLASNGQQHSVTISLR